MKKDKNVYLKFQDENTFMDDNLYRVYAANHGVFDDFIQRTGVTYHRISTIALLMSYINAIVEMRFVQHRIT